MRLPKLSSVIRATRSGQIWRVLPHYYYSRRNSGLIDQTPPVAAAAYGSAGALEVCMMTGEVQHYDLLVAAKSFLTQYPGPVSLAIHCNETITPDAVARMQRHLPNARTWTRPQRDAIVIPYLKKLGFRRSIHLREQYVFATRILDAFILSSADRILSHDSDILSFRPLTRLHMLANATEPVNVFGKDPAAATHGLTPERMKQLFGITDIKDHLNGGFCLVHRSAVDHRMLDEWLGVPDFPWQNYFLEQLFLVLFMARDWGRTPIVEVLPPEEYNMGRTIENAESTCDLVHYCGHYLSKTRIAMQSIGQRLIVRSLMAGQP